MSKRKILIVDDEEDLLEMLAMRLEASGQFEVSRAHDGEEAFRRAGQLRPDVVLLDNVMPGLTGWEVCRKLREDEAFRDTAIVMMTAGTPQVSERMAVEYHADALILKPYDQAEVLRTLGTITRART
jgi:DNA-binding response OmpR family regulator